MDITVEKVKNALKDQQVSALLVRSTDKYFNEYVPKSMSIRQKLTGFDGSVGDAIISDKGMHLFVDGRYTLQAESQAKGFFVHVTSSADSIETSWLKKLPEILSAGETLAYDPASIDLNLFERIQKTAQELGAKLVAKPEITGEVLKSLPGVDLSSYPIFSVANVIGDDIAHKNEIVRQFLASNQLDALLVVKLDDIAWLTNLRSYCFPYQSSIPGIAMITKDGLLLGLAKGLKKSDLKESCDEDDLWSQAMEHFRGKKAVVGIDPKQTSKAHEMALRAIGVEIRSIENPISYFKAIKNEKEKLHMRSAFKKADEVVYQTQKFVIESFEKKQSLSEGDVDDHIKDGFKKSGAEQLSFRPICASGKNGAIIHYGSPDHSQAVVEGSLFLLDTGAYYQGGYATDLTRTFLAAPNSRPAEKWQKEMFTLVLKASIAGLSARFRKGTIGMQLDAIVRAPLWQKGLDFAHGTGHGVGINVHEFPPRIGPTSTSILLENQVFSIEPGLYFKDIGGVRIENLATIVKDPEHNDFLRVLPLTFCPLDERLIDHDMLDEHEKNFLVYFANEWQGGEKWPSLPPLKTVKFG
jgi:Xaa-Pro aminopeptidase